MAENEIGQWKAIESGKMTLRKSWAIMHTETKAGQWRHEGHWTALASSDHDGRSIIYSDRL